MAAEQAVTAPLRAYRALSAWGRHDLSAATSAGQAPGAQAAVAAVASNSDRGARIAAIMIAISWHVVVNVPAIALSWDQFHWPWVAAGGWLVYAGVGLHAAVRLLRDRPLRAWPLIGLLLAVDAAVFVATPRESLFESMNWGWSTLGWFAMVVLWGRRITLLIGVVAAGAVIALVAVLAADGPRAVDLSRYVMYVYGTAVLPIALAVGGAVIGTLAASRARAAAARAGVEAEREAAVTAQRERQARLDLVSRTAGAILRELAQGSADPADPQVQRRCALAAARLRRLIAESDDVPDPLLHELRACADIAERHGLPVDLITVGTVPTLPVAARRRLVEPLVATLATANGWARLTVVAEPGEVVVSLVAPAGVADPTTPVAGVVATATDPATDRTGQAASDVDVDVEYIIERDEELVWVQTRWRAM